MKNLIILIIFTLFVMSCSPNTMSCAYKVKHQKKEIKTKQKVKQIPYYVRINKRK